MKNDWPLTLNLRLFWRKIFIFQFLLFGLLASATVPGADIPYAAVQVLTNGSSNFIAQAAKVLPRPNQVAWMNLEFTFFIHYGLEPFNDDQGGVESSPSTFNPTHLDAGQWVNAIKNAGGKQLVFVAKHVDGFCLWPSRYTSYSVASSPWLGSTGDVVRAVANACQANGIKLGVYICQADNNSKYINDGSIAVSSVIPTAPANFISNPMIGRTPPAGFTNYVYKATDYQRYYLNQLYELLTEYGPVSEVWFDGGIGNVPDAIDLVHKLQPNAVMFQGGDLRWVGNENGVARASEWSVIPLPACPDPLTNFGATYNATDWSAADLGGDDKLTAGAYLWWFPAESDTTIQAGDNWFWNPGISVLDVPSLLNDYYCTVGRNVNLNLDLAPDTSGLIPADQLAALSSMGQIIANTFVTNLAANATITADTANPTNPPSAVLDGNLDTWWEAAPGQTNGTLTLTLPAPVKFDVISLQEAVAQRSQRIESWSIDSWSGSSWTNIGSYTTVGHKRLERVNPVTTSKVRIRINGSRLEPTLAEVGLYRQAINIAAPTISNRSASGYVTITNGGGNNMVFTLDGSTPTIRSLVYSGPIYLPLGGSVHAACLSAQDQIGLTASATFPNLAPIGWRVVAVDSQNPSHPAINAIDGDPTTFWLTQTNADLALPHYITVDMGTNRWLGGFTYLPRQDGNANGTVYQFRFETSPDGVAWVTNSTGYLFNIAVGMGLQSIQFSPVKARYFRFTALQEINTNGWTSAAEISVVPAGFDARLRGYGLQTNGPF